jgi:glycosyltransferase involved in cell wall biosynthesis
METRLRILFVSIVPPHNDCGVRIVMHRHLVERNPFELHVASNADFAGGLLVHTPLRLPYPLQRLRKSRFGPRFRSWLTDYENFVWTLTVPSALDQAIQEFKPDLILTLAETSVCHLAAKAARKHRLPLAGLFLDWFPIMQGHFGHQGTQAILSRRYRELYAACDLAFCTSDGMQEILGPHPNSHVIYPMPGRHQIPDRISPPKTGKFRLVYVGSVQNFYGRMICSLIEQIAPASDLEIIVVGPNADWPAELLQRARAKSIYLGFRPPAEAAAVLAGADALLVVMSFEKEFELFMRTSFTTKFLDYVAFGKPVILWGPDYCTPFRVASQHGGALAVNQIAADGVVAACRQMAGDPVLRDRLAREARQLHQTVFNPDRLQHVFTSEIQKLAGARDSKKNQ